MIEVEHLTVGYHGEPVLQGVDLTFPTGQVTVLLGPNGCGKSTLLKTALGLIQPLSGRVLYDGTPITELSTTQIARLAAYMPQSRTVPNITAGRLVLHGRFAYLSFPRRYRKVDHDAVAKALRLADAADLTARPLPELSGGQRQKVYLAMALAQDTPTVFMDEPTTFLDVRHQLDVMATARRLAEQGRAVVLVSHDLCLALRYADRVAVLAKGALRQIGTAAEVVASGVLDEAFGVKVHALETQDGTRYFCETMYFFTKTGAY